MRRQPREPARRSGEILRIAIEGPSGVGKTTVSRALARRLGALWIREAYDRLAPRPSLEVASAAELVRVERRLLREETLRHAEAVQEGRLHGTVVLDTGFLGPATYAAGLADREGGLRPAAGRIVRATDALVHARRLELPELTVYLEAGSGELRRRNAKAVRSHPPHLQRRHREVARFERRFWRDVVAVRDPRAVWFVRATARPAVIVDRLEARIARRRPARPSRALTRTSLRTLAMALNA